MIKISCLIPAYNEGPRIRNVLKAVDGHPLINEIIVIDDCSKDDTSKVVSEFQTVRLVKHEINKGKSQAIITGLREARNDTVMLIDADLVGITAQDIANLVKPVIDNEADMSISLRKNAPAVWHWIGLDYISGERVLPKELLLSHVFEIAKLRPFGLETWMNKLIIAEKYRIKVVHWNHVESPFKYNKSGKKYNPFIAIKDELPMMRDIFKTASPIAILAMIYRMRSLCV